MDPEKRLEAFEKMLAEVQNKLQYQNMLSLYKIYGLLD